MIEPGVCALLLGPVARVAGIEEDVSVDETRAGHRVPRAWDKASTDLSGRTASPHATHGRPPRTRATCACARATPHPRSATGSCFVRRRARAPRRQSLRPA